MLCYRCGGHVKDGSEKCPSCGQPFPLGLKPGSIAGFGTGSRRGRAAIEGAPYKIDDAVAARFQVKDHLGAGPLGWVFRAVDTESGASVSLKVLSPRFLQLPEEQAAFLGELERTCALDHPNVARTIASGLDGQRPWIASQLLDGLTLRRIMDLRRQKGQSFALHEIEPIVAQIAAALDASPVAHGDLKPDNVVVLPDLLKLTDFGLALCLPRAPLVAAQRAAGAQRYFAPEVLAGAELAGRADVFSLGVMLGEMLGGAPFDAQLEARVRAAGVPVPVEQVFLRAVAPRPEERFASAADLSAALSDAIHGAPPSSGDDDDVVIEHAQTDPRVRIARALAAQDAERAARSQLEAKEAKAKGLAAELPSSLQLSLTPLPPLSVPPLSIPPLALEPFSAPPPASLPPVAPLASPSSAPSPAGEHAGARAAAAPPESARASPPAQALATPLESPRAAPARVAAATIEAAPPTPPAREAAESKAAAEPSTDAAAPERRAPLESPPAAAAEPKHERSTVQPARTASESAPTGHAPPDAEVTSRALPSASAVAAEGARGHVSSEEVARIAARVGATPELLTAETAVRFAPTAPASAAAAAFAEESAPATAPAAPPASSAPTSATPAAASAAPASIASNGDGAAAKSLGLSDASEDATEATEAPEAPPASEPPPSGEEPAGRGKKRGRGRKGKREEARARRQGEPAVAISQSASSSVAARAAADTQELSPVPAASVAAAATAKPGPARPGEIVAIQSISALSAELPASPGPPRAGKPLAPALEKPLERPPGDPPGAPPDAPPSKRAARAAAHSPSEPSSFGALAAEKRGLSAPAIAILAVALIAAALFGWSQLSSRSAEEKSAGSASATVAPATTPTAATLPAPAAALDAGPAAAAQAPSEGATALHAKETPRSELPPAREFEEKASKGGKKSFLERLRERRDASKHGADPNRPPGHHAEGEPAPEESPASPPAATPALAASQPPAPAPAAGASGGIAGVDDDNLLASRDPEQRKKAAAELAAAAGVTSQPPAAPAPAPVAAGCPEGMKLIAAGAAVIGTDASDDMRNFGDRAAATVQLKAYCIDLYEWPDAAGKTPKIAAGFSEAEASCKRVGKRLCSENEWEKACKGPANLRFPYGSAFDPDACNTQDKSTNPRKLTAAGAFANCRSGYGVYDLSGNAAEWTASSFEGASSDRAVKGGSAARPGFDDRCSSRRRLPSGTHDINVGFRCCADLQ